MRATIILILSLFLAGDLFAKSYPSPINAEDVTIVRDEYGVPHIYGKTDADVAYGLAYANSEDAFFEIQERMLVAKGLMGIYKGKEGAPIDYFVHSLGVREIVQEKMSDVDPTFLDYLQAYCQGLNDYAAQHPKEVLIKKAFPIGTADVLESFMISFAFLSQVHVAVKEIVEGPVDKEMASLGSNAYALNSSRTEEGKTFLCINPHFQVEGPFSFYEAHMISEEGMNVRGALFQGGTSVFMGNNESLGWGMTFNFFDRVDTYELEMHPKKKHSYQVDGKWYELEKRPVSLKVKVGNVLTVPVKKNCYWSIYGPTYESPDGKFYAVRSGSFLNINGPEQFYRMGKSDNFEQFQEAMDINAIPLFNIIYADKQDNIHYLSNGVIPVRAAGYDWDGIVPGNTFETLWTHYHPVRTLPHVTNPECGFVFNTNNTPFNATCAEENDDRDRLPAYVDAFPGDNNRAIRLLELINEKDLHSYEALKRIKFDNRFSENSPVVQSLQGLFEMKPEDYPDISSSLQIIQGWDLAADLNSTAATLVSLSLNYIFEWEDYGTEHFIYGLDCEPSVFEKAIVMAQEYLTAKFGTIEVPLSQYQKFVRRGEELSSAGFADVLMACYATEPLESGSYQLSYADTYIHFVEFGPDGPEKIETLLPFGNHSKVGDYTDQLEMFNQQKMKKVTMDTERILERAVSQYHPGQRYSK